MTTLTDFLLARIAEDDEMARAWDGQGQWHVHGFGPVTDYGVRFNPPRILAECRAKRRIVAMMAYWDESMADYRPDGVVTAEQMALQLLALPYADHPDYDKEWRP